MKLREIIRPQLNESKVKDTVDQANEAAKEFWTKAWPTIKPYVKGAAAVLIVHEIYQGFKEMASIDCSDIPENECKAAQRAIWARLFAQYGVASVVFWVGSISMGWTGPYVWVAGPVAGIIAMAATHFFVGTDVDKAADWCVKVWYGMDSSSMLAKPVATKSEPAQPRMNGRQAQQNYRQGQVGMDTPNNPNPRLHPERYPKD